MEVLTSEAATITISEWMEINSRISLTWWIWQNQDLESRQNVVAGTITMDNSPPTRNGSLADLIDLGVNATAIPIAAVMSATGDTGGPLCYIYV